MMKSLFKNIFALTLTLSCMSLAKANEINHEVKGFVKELAVFDNYLGTWESVFEQKDGKPTMVDVSTWERALNGTTLRTTHSINDGMYGGESLFFYDKEKDKIVFYYFTTAGFYTNGWLEPLADGTFDVYEEVTGKKDITKVKSNFKLMDNTMSVSTSYFKNNEWTTPESRTYRRSTKEVKFK